VPTFGYTISTSSPETIRVIRVYNTSAASMNGALDTVDDWVREGWRVLTNEISPIYAEVLQRVDESTFSPGMVLALAARLTAAFAIPLTENRQLAKDFMDFYEALIKDAGRWTGRRVAPSSSGRRHSRDAGKSVKFNFLQGDFSAGELSPRAQGHAESEAYKAGLKLAANWRRRGRGASPRAPGWSFCWRASTATRSRRPTSRSSTSPSMDGPFGDMVLEVSPTGIRLLDKNGVIIPWNFLPVSELLQFTVQDGSFAYGDPDTRTVYLRSLAASGVRSYYASKATLDAYSGGRRLDRRTPSSRGSCSARRGQKSVRRVRTITGHLSGKIAGDSVTAHIVQSTPGQLPGHRHCAGRERELLHHLPPQCRRSRPGLLHPVEDGERRHAPPCSGTSS
jgi:thiamine phosphate synthase YjbQ (UPF0047 family)